ncbi:MAG TPA: N-methyl-L-tryptophan oxidase [Gemmatimonadaceae bacterium]|nr:N-methyl-L-tryptophan oxidase [Gemmatimonadaceae bacterium]
MSERNGARYDVIVVGLGAMGSAIAFELARRGKRVLGVDRWEPPHTYGSTHGKSRIIREAYFEDPGYVPLVARAFEKWEEIERLSGRRIFERTGGLMLGPASGRLVSGALASAKTHGLQHEVVDAAAVSRRVPGLRAMADMVGVVEPRAGALRPEVAVSAYLELARNHGARIVTGERVTGWDDRDGLLRVTTAHETYTGERLVIAAGAWTSDLVRDLRVTLRVERQVQHWFRPATPTDLFAPERFPVVICEYAPGRYWYAIPGRDEGLKIAIHHEGAIVNPEHVDRNVGAEEVEYVRALLRTYMPSADGALIESSVCLYTNTPDERFLVETHPTHSNVEIVSACSGHGFKFASAIGEIVAERVTGGSARQRLLEIPGTRSS